MANAEPQILLTNDDGIDSPGLWAAAEALSALGYVWVAAPREQSSGAGRSMPTTSDGRITSQKTVVHGKEWTVYAVGGSPAQTVQHAILEILPAIPNLLVSGINYGSNLGTGVTVSGTVGAAMEGASNGVPSLAVSLDTDRTYHLSHSKEVDFSAAAYFTAYFARVLLKENLGPEVSVLKVEVPANATSQTPWEVNRLATERFYVPLPPQPVSENESRRPDYTTASDLDKFPPDTDVYALLVKGVVSVTPLTLDMTARLNLKQFEHKLRKF